MSEEIPTLLSIAQIAGVFVGFAALVSVLGGRPDGAPRVLELGRFRGVVGAGVLVVVASLLPVVLGRYPISEPVVWRLSCAGFLILIWLLILSSRQSVDVMREMIRGSPVSFILLVLVLEPVIQVPLALGLLGLLPSLASAFYLTALIVNLCQAAFVFSQLVLSDAFSLRG